MLLALRDGKARKSRRKAAQMLLQSRDAFIVGRHSNCSGTFKKSRASKTSRRRVGPVWVKVDATGLLRRQSSYDWTSGVNPLPFISTVWPQSLPDFDQPASTILWRPKCLSRSTHQPLKMLSDIGYAWLTFRFRPGAAIPNEAAKLTPEVVSRGSSSSQREAIALRALAATDRKIPSRLPRRSVVARSWFMRTPTGDAIQSNSTASR
jgi:hypothetical protein